jgi:hypothetical protein
LLANINVEPEYSVKDDTLTKVVEVDISETSLVESNQ